MSRSSTIIVGAGPIGLACAISARRRGEDPLVVEAGPIAASIARYPVGMAFFTTPERLEIGGHPLVSSAAKASREEALKYYRGVVRAEEIRVRTYTRMTGASRENGRIGVEVTSRQGSETLACDRLVMATGYFDHPNLLGVPGEELPHVSHYGEEPHCTAGLDVVIVGGKNSAVEQALNCYRAGARVTMVYRKPELRQSVKYWLRPDLENRIKSGEIAARWSTEVARITPLAVEVFPAGDRDQRPVTEAIPADRVYLLTGYRPDFELFRSMGIELDADGRPRVNPDTLETNVPGIHMAGSVLAGKNTSEIFIENGRWDGEKIFGGDGGRRIAAELYAKGGREVGE